MLERIETKGKLRHPGRDALARGIERLQEEFDLRPAIGNGTKVQALLKGHIGHVTTGRFQITERLGDYTAAYCIAP